MVVGLPFLFRGAFYSEHGILGSDKKGVLLGVSYKHLVDAPHYMESYHTWHDVRETSKVHEVGDNAEFIIDYANEPNYNIISLGSSGSGKSQTCKAFIARASISYGVKFLIIDYNGEYVKFAKDTNSAIWKAGESFKINPFLLNGMSPEERASLAIESLVVCAKITPLQAGKVKSALLKHYKSGKEPTLLELWKELCSKKKPNDLIDQRFRSIQRVIGSEPREFWESILTRNNVVDLSSLNDSEKALAAHVILERIYELFNSNTELNNRLRLSIMVDEAWRVLQNATYEDQEYESLLSRIARQGRKYGFGIVIATQQLEDLPQTFINSSAIKVLHNYQDSNYLNSISNTFKLSTFESAYLNSAGIGEAIVLDSARKASEGRWWGDYVKVASLSNQEMQILSNHYSQFTPGVINEAQLPIEEYEMSVDDQEDDGDEDEEKPGKGNKAKQRVRNSRNDTKGGKHRLHESARGDKGLQAQLGKGDRNKREPYRLNKGKGHNRA